MKILNIEKIECLQIETDEEHFSTYRRYSPEIWEVLMGMSWESVQNPEQIKLLEEAHLLFHNL